MPRRPPEFRPRETDKGWEISIPASQSETGRRRKIYFRSETAAKNESAKRRRTMRQMGEQARIDPALASEAVRAAALLEEFDTSLLVAVRQWVGRRREQERSITLQEAWETRDAYHVENSRPYTLRDHRQAGKNLPGWLLGKLVCDITRDDLKRALDETGRPPSTRDLYLRHLKAVLGACVREEFARDNPAARVQPAERRKDRDVRILTVAELKAVFKGCQDSPEAAVAFAFLAYAGIRPKELERLEWGEVSLEMGNIRIASATSKTRTVRNIGIEPVLGAWIQTIPETERRGKVLPDGWRKTRAAVCADAGIGGLADVFRHSYGSYWIAVHGDLPGLQSRMGHSHANTFFKFYHNSVTKRQALPYWQVAPEGVELNSIAAA